MKSSMKTKTTERSTH